ncbi:pseudouridine-5'-phosphate glycosidase [Lentzea sp. NPDC003310]|uniref:pseudouridine-5'-phosphate glycosidase n=1 Tax=Lentzea sp. NPDC003310 TaxID=3154447 RepID=UPI00339E5822
MRIPLVYSEEVAEAITAGQPVVALPSSVLRSGPDDAETARLTEDAVRVSGSVPATIGVDKGRILVGLSESDFERFACTPGVPQAGARDLPVALARGATAATTASSSLVAAGLAGLRFLCSAETGDLVRLAAHRVAVVCAETPDLDLLESQGVPLACCDDPVLVARAIETHWALGHPGSFVVTAPVPPAVDSAGTTKATRAVRVGTAEVAGGLAAAHAKEYPS